MKNLLCKWIFSKKSEQKNSLLHRLIFYSLILSILSILFCGLILYSYFQEKPINFTITNDIAVIISVIGVFITFSAINIYSIFNARVGEEKERLKEIESGIYEKYETFEKMYTYKLKYLSDEQKIITDRMDKFLKEQIEELRQGLLVEISLNNILTDHISAKDKGTAVGFIKERINYLEKWFEETDSISNKNEAEGKLIEFAKDVYFALDTYYQTPRNEMNNAIYMRMLNSLLEKLREILRRFHIDFE